MTRVGPYELTHMLASSAHDERWLARGPHGAAVVEVWTATDGGLRADLVSAARSAMALDHPGIARVLAAGESETPAAAWVVHPADLADDLELLAPLPPSYAARVVHDAARALVSAHAAGQVHGALTAHHVLLGYDGGVRLSGFGAARRAVGERARSGALSPGLAAMLSPEMLASAHLTAASDVYSLGRLLALAAGGVEALPLTLRAIHDQCTQDEPGSRLPGVSALAAAIHDAAVSELGALPTAVQLGTYLRETLPTRHEERSRQWRSVSGPPPPAVTPINFNIPRDPSNPGSQIPIFDAAITTLFVRDSGTSDGGAPDPLRQSTPIAGTWAALSTAFAAPQAPLPSTAYPPIPAARDEEDEQDATVRVIGVMLVIALGAFLVGALYLGPSAQSDLVEMEDTVPVAAPVVAAPDLPMLPLPDPAMWIIPEPAASPSATPRPPR